MKRCHVRNINLWGAHPRHSRLNYLTNAEAIRKIREPCKEAEDLEMQYVIYAPEPLN